MSWNERNAMNLAGTWCVTDGAPTDGGGGVVDVPTECEDGCGMASARTAGMRKGGRAVAPRGCSGWGAGEAPGRVSWGCSVGVPCTRGHRGRWVCAHGRGTDERAGASSAVHARSDRQRDWPKFLEDTFAGPSRPTDEWARTHRDDKKRMLFFALLSLAQATGNSSANAGFLVRRAEATTANSLVAPSQSGSVTSGSRQRGETSKQGRWWRRGGGVSKGGVDVSGELRRGLGGSRGECEKGSGANAAVAGTFLNGEEVLGHSPCRQRRWVVAFFGMCSGLTRLLEACWVATPD